MSGTIIVIEQKGEEYSPHVWPVPDEKLFHILALLEKPDVPVIPEYKHLYVGWVEAYVLNVREGPGVEYKEVNFGVYDFNLVRGQIIYVWNDIDGWGKIHPLEDHWISLNYVREIG